MLCLYHIVDLTKFSTIALVLEVMSNKDHAMESPDNFIFTLKNFLFPFYIYSVLIIYVFTRIINFIKITSTSG
jgi:hypothetical protein